MNTEQERAEFEAFESKHGLCVTKEGELYRSHVIRWMWKAWQARAALQSQDEDIFSPTSLTGLSKDELIRQLQWALNYWMPNIADDGTPDGERAAREAYLLLGMQAPVGREEENTPTYWERVSDLQSQDREDAERYRWLRDGGNDDMGVVRGFDCIDCGSTTVAGTYEEGLEGGQLDAAIDHARRVEGGET